MLYKELSINRVIPGIFGIQIAALEKLQLNQSEIQSVFLYPKGTSKKLRYVAKKKLLFMFQLYA